MDYVYAFSLDVFYRLNGVIALLYTEKLEQIYFFQIGKTFVRSINFVKILKK